ncbi:hypothetical protein ACUOCP_29530, partial [Escherichia sp. R-CC3]
MFSALRHRTAALALGVCFILPVHASSPKPGDFANTQARHIATFFSVSLIRLSKFSAPNFPSSSPL